MNNIVKFPLKIRLYKFGDMVYFSQLDMVSVLERALRRSKLPIYFSQGFNPRVKMSFHSSLKLGLEGEIETTFYFNRLINFDEMTTALSPQLPTGLELKTQV